MDNLPGDIIKRIFSRFDVEELYIFRHVCKKFKSLTKKGIINIESLGADFAKMGCVALVDWSISLGYKFNKSISNAAIQNGHIELVQYLYMNKCPFDDSACIFAAIYGHLDILKYLHGNGYALNSAMFTAAVENGWLDIVKYLHVNKCPYTKWIIYKAATNERLDILKYLHTNKYPVCNWTYSGILYSIVLTSDRWTLTKINRSIESGWLAMLKYLHENNYRCEKDDYFELIVSLRPEVLKFLHENIIYD